MNLKTIGLWHMIFLLRFRVFIGIKKLLGLIDMARQTEQQYRLIKFLSKLEEEGGLDAGTSIQ